jgi:hypothetical protein
VRLFRYVEPNGVVAALPVVVLEETAERVVVHVPDGSEVAWPSIGGQPHRSVPLESRYRSPWRASTRTWNGSGPVIVHPPGRAHTIWHLYDAGAFSGWYVNLETPWRRTSLGFDSRDHVLDVWVEPGGAWRWKDEDELVEAVAAGWLTQGEAEAARAEGERVLAEWPFPTGWEGRRSDPAWGTPALPEGWSSADLCG